MARCRCATETCTCLVVGGSGAVVTGSGSFTNPFVVTVSPSIAGAIEFVDSPTIDFTVTGSGVGGNPYIVTADVIMVDGGGA